MSTSHQRGNKTREEMRNEDIRQELKGDGTEREDTRKQAKMVWTP